MFRLFTTYAAMILLLKKKRGGREKKKREKLNFILLRAIPAKQITGCINLLCAHSVLHKNFTLLPALLLICFFNNKQKKKSEAIYYPFKNKK